MSFSFAKIILLFQVVLSTPLFAELTHRAIIGEPFNGTSNDETHRLNLKAGSFAQLVDVNGLHASVFKNRVISGSATPVRASILFDDGTRSEIEPAGISWSFDSPGLQLLDDSLLAGYVDKRRIIRVRASTMGFASAFVVFVLPKESPVKEANLNLPDALGTTLELEYEGWRESDWFGIFYEASNGWIFHSDLGWLRTAPVTGSSSTVWLWSENQEWFWTGEGIYPHLFRNRDAAWLYHFKEALPSIIFYNHQNARFEGEMEN